jgi:toxin CptA
MTSAPAIGFEYRPSRWLGRVLLTVAALAALALWSSATPLLIKSMLSLVLVTAAVRSLLRFVRSPVLAAGWSQQGGWTLRLAGGEDQAATLGAFRVVGEQLVWLHLVTPGLGPCSLLLAPDNSDADIRRRLRMRLALAEPLTAPAPGTLPAERGPTV